jgi:uncharacterized membrane protein YdjX (TVP38/TMEM64 family)
MGTALLGNRLRLTALALVIAAGVGLAAAVGVPGIAAVRSAVDAAGGAGWLLLVVGLALLLLGPVPRSATSVVIGAVLGFGPGLLVAFTGGLLGGIAAFTLSRTLGRSTVLRLAGPRLARVDEVMTGRGFSSVLVGRVLPVLPFVAVSYGAGLLGVRFLPYLAATAVGLVPSTLVQVGLGASAGLVADGAPVLAVLPALTAAVVLSVLGMFLLRRRSRTAAAGRSAPAEEPADHAAGRTDRARRQLEDRSARDARHLLGEGRQ